MARKCDMPKVADSFLQLSNAKSHSHAVLLPFLYETPTIQRRSFASSHTIRRGEEYESREQRRGRIRSQFERPTQYRRLKLDPELHRHQGQPSGNPRTSPSSPSLSASEHDRYFAANPSEPPTPDTRPKRDTTITDLERDAFSKLFRSLAREEEAAASSTTSPNLSPDDIAALTLVDEVTDPDAESSGPSSSSRSTTDYDIDTIMARELLISEPRISAYPTALQSLARDTETRVAAARATQERRRRMEEAEPGTLEARRFTKGIAVGLKSARTDAEVWKVLEEQVFVHVRGLKGKFRAPKGEWGRGVDVSGIGPAVVDEEVLEAQKRARGKRRKGEEEDERNLEVGEHLGFLPGDPEVKKMLSAQNSEEKDFAKPDLIDLPILRRVYPASLLLAVRILANRTHDTPFLPALLPTIRTLHPLSLILGASTPLYNELLKYTWRTTSSIFSVLNLLEDMSNIGLSMDNQTWEILERITLYRYRAMRGDFGIGVAALENMAKRKEEGQRLWRWKADIKTMLEEVQLGKAQRVMPLEQMPQMRGTGDERLRSADGAETIRYHSVG